MSRITPHTKNQENLNLQEETHLKNANMYITNMYKLPEKDLKTIIKIALTCHDEHA